MIIAAYKGTSFVSKLIQFVTRSRYSHVSFVFDATTAKRAEAMRQTYPILNRFAFLGEGAVVEAWYPDGVRNTRGLNEGHEPGTVIELYKFVTPLSYLDEQDLLMWLNSEIGKPYGVRNILRFITKQPGKLDKTRFCSEQVTMGCVIAHSDLFNNTLPYLVPPDWIPRSTAIEYFDTHVIPDK